MASMNLADVPNRVTPTSSARSNSTVGGYEGEPS